MTTAHLVRHGQIKANREGRWHGSTDSSLTWRGRRQAKRTGKHLRAADLSFTAAYVSPLQRCQNTARYILKDTDIEPVIIDDLREYAIGEWEDLPFSVLHSEHDFMRRARADLSYEPPGGESIATVAARMRSAFAAIAERHGDDEDVLVVSHGACLAVLLADLLHADPGRWADYHLANCSHTRLLLGETPVVDGFNQTTHL